MTQARGRSKIALSAFVRQEFGAPVETIIGLAEILIEDAGVEAEDALVADLAHIRDAGAQLLGLLGQLLETIPRLAGRPAEEIAFAKARLRHDLRTPLNAVKGYGELILEEARDGGREALGDDVVKLVAAADQLLGQVDALVDFADGAAAPPTLSAAPTPRERLGEDLRAILPVWSAPSAPGQAKPSRIFVVDDTRANRELLSRRLTREGHEIEMAEDGLAALERVAASSFDLVLLDMMMPGMNGFEVLRHLKSDAAARHIPVIMISALDDLDSIVGCIEAGAEDYLPKPCNPVLLRARINASLEKKRLRDREKAFFDELRVEKEKSDALLLHILPKDIVARMHGGEVVIADRFPEATILFADIVGFTSLAGKLSPSRIIEFLNDLFSRFDRLAATLGLEKIKTIGDAYLLASGLPTPRDDHALAAADMALGMIDIVEKGEASLGEANLGERLAIRVGMHSGEVAAGVIGRHKFIYDVWGDTVNTASRLESHGLPNRVHVSEATFELLRDSFACAPRGVVDIKGKGEMATYWLGARQK